MKKLMTVVLTLMVAGTLAFAQTGGGSTDASKTTTEHKGGKTTKTSKAHKGGKKSKKSSNSTGTTTPPK